MDVSNYQFAEDEISQLNKYRDYQLLYDMITIFVQWFIIQILFPN